MLVRGYSLMLGLHKQERADVFDADGWFHTGDRGLFRDGWFFFTGRQSDLIKTKGANVAPAEVEKALLGLDGVASAYVFGVAHPEHGEDVVALVVAAGIGARPGYACALARTALVVQDPPPHLRDRAGRRAPTSPARSPTDAAWPRWPGASPSRPGPRR